MEIGLQFLLRVAEHRGVTRVHGNVGQVVQVGKERNVTEFADAGHKEKAFLMVAIFEDAVKPFQALLDFFDMGIGDIVKDRLVVFIDQDHDFLFFRFVMLHQLRKSGRRIVFRG